MAGPKRRRNDVRRTAAGNGLRHHNFLSSLRNERRGVRRAARHGCCAPRAALHESLRPTALGAEQTGRAEEGSLSTHALSSGR